MLARSIFTQPQFHAFYVKPRHILRVTCLGCKRMLASQSRPVSCYGPKKITTPNGAPPRPDSTPVQLQNAPLEPSDWSNFSIDCNQPVLYQNFQVSRRANSRASELISTLREGQDTLVEVELGRFDAAHERGFDQVPMRLGQYLDWLESDRSSGCIEGRQVYLAQWRARDEIAALRNSTKPPPMLATLMAERRVDLYQTALFLGPTGAITPFHYDPYMNLYHLEASSVPTKYVKHVTLLPPTLSGLLRHVSNRVIQRNTATINIHLRREPMSSPSLGFQIAFSSDVPIQMADAVQAHAVTCLLREGETLFIPRGWWHRVENVCLESGSPERSGWTAGMSWWFLAQQAQNHCKEIHVNE